MTFEEVKQKLYQGLVEQIGEQGYTIYNITPYVLHCVRGNIPGVRILIDQYCSKEVKSNPLYSSALEDLVHAIRYGGTCLSLIANKKVAGKRLVAYEKLSKEEQEMLKGIKRTL